MRSGRKRESTAIAGSRNVSRPSSVATWLTSRTPAAAVSPIWPPASEPALRSASPSVSPTTGTPSTAPPADSKPRWIEPPASPTARGMLGQLRDRVVDPQPEPREQQEQHEDEDVAEDRVGSAAGDVGVEAHDRLLPGRPAKLRRRPTEPRSPAPAGRSVTRGMSRLYYDLASPYAYLAVARAAEGARRRARAAAGAFGRIFGYRGRGSWALDAPSARPARPRSRPAGGRVRAAAVGVASRAGR